VTVLNAPRVTIIVIALTLGLPPLVCAQVWTESTTMSHSTGPTNSTYVWSILRFVPATVITGDLGSCTLQSPPYPACVLVAGIGTPADPFFYNCSSALTVTDCTLPGLPIDLLPSQRDINTHFPMQVAEAATLTQPVPLAPWVPIGSALVMALVAFAAQPRARAAR
jgi:hypothetical protein